MSKINSLEFKETLMDDQVLINTKNLQNFLKRGRHSKLLIKSLPNFYIASQISLSRFELLFHKCNWLAN